MLWSRFSNSAATDCEVLQEKHCRNWILSGFSIKFIYVFVVSLHLNASVGRGKGPVDGAPFEIASIGLGQHFSTHRGHVGNAAI